jgi:hypothetical protein
VRSDVTALRQADVGSGFRLVLDTGTFHLRPGGRLAIADIVNGRALKERTRRNVELWAACIAGATPRSTYVAALEANGLELKELRTNDYRFISERALDACSTYEVESISLRAARPNLEDGDEGGSR